MLDEAGLVCLRFWVTVIGQQVVEVLGAALRGGAVQGLGLEDALAQGGPTPKWQQQMELIATLPRAKQQVVMQMLDGLLAGSAAA